MKSIIKFKTILIVIFFITLANKVNSQAPQWSVNTNAYEYSMTLVAFVNINGTPLDSSDDKVAAFINNEVRGVANLVYEEDYDRYYAYLTVFANANNEDISFKVYDSANDQVEEIPSTLPFQINGHVGNLFQAFSIANPVLSSEANILDISLVGETVNSVTYNEDEINIYVENGVVLQNLNLAFSLSDGAEMFYNNTLVESENNSFDFSTPLNFVVRSEDHTQLSNYTVFVSFSGLSADYNFYKIDAVCYRGGYIKVESNNENQQVQLFQNEVLISNQNIISGQTVFSGLDIGTYKVLVNGIEKIILIELKE
ncbi:hypothetical protein [Winogradskyella sp.]|uniref:hypothetical protein n=2 Tax=Winogradskyella sp. TaxID=1883156 RepID=UPI0035149820